MIDREEIIAYPREKLPADAEFKGYAEVLIQALKITTESAKDATGKPWMRVTTLRG